MKRTKKQSKTITQRDLLRLAGLIFAFTLGSLGIIMFVRGQLAEIDDTSEPLPQVQPNQLTNTSHGTLDLSVSAVKGLWTSFNEGMAPPNMTGKLWVQTSSDQGMELGLYGIDNNVYQPTHSLPANIGHLMLLADQSVIFVDLAEPNKIVWRGAGGEQPLFFAREGESILDYNLDLDQSDLYIAVSSSEGTAIQVITARGQNIELASNLDIKVSEIKVETDSVWLLTESGQCFLWADSSATEQEYYHCYDSDHVFTNYTDISASNISGAAYQVSAAGDIQELFVLPAGELASRVMEIPEGGHVFLKSKLLPSGTQLGAYQHSVVMIKEGIETLLHELTTSEQVTSIDYAYGQIAIIISDQISQQTTMWLIDPVTGEKATHTIETCSGSTTCSVSIYQNSSV